MSPGERDGGNTRKGGAAGGGGGGRPAMAVGAWAVSALCLLLSVGSAAACLLLGAQASALQGRVAALEEERELLRRTGVPGALSTWAEPHLERLLREVRSIGGDSRKGVHGTGGECPCPGSPGQCGRLPEEGLPASSVHASPPWWPARGAEVGKAKCRPRRGPAAPTPASRPRSSAGGLGKSELEGPFGDE